MGPAAAGQFVAGPPAACRSATGASGTAAVTDPLVSVVVPTYRRVASLDRLLAGLARQRDAPSFEVLVVDNDPGRSAQTVVAAWARRGLVIPQPNLAESTPGAAAARNTGLRRARGSIVAFLDDDVVPAPDWLAGICQPLASGRAGVSAGRVVLDPGVPRPRWLDEAGLGGYLAGHDLGPRERPLGPGDILLTANAAFRTADLRAVGGFDAALGPRGRGHLVCDDVAALRAVRARGAVAVYSPATVVHELPMERLRVSWLLRRAYLQGRSDWLLDARMLADRRAGGARVALSWLTGECVRRRTELTGGVPAQMVVVHLGCDVARTVGALREGVRLSRRNTPRPAVAGERAGA